LKSHRVAGAENRSNDQSRKRSSKSIRSPHH